MNRWSGFPARSSWWRWPTLGLLMTIAFLAHDVAMASATAGEMTHTGASSGLTTDTRIHHVISTGDSAHDAGLGHSVHHACEGDACPIETMCGIARDAVPTDTDLLLLTMQAMTGESMPISVWQAAPDRHLFASTLLPSSHDQRIMYQVFLI